MQRSSIGAGVRRPVGPAQPRPKVEVTDPNDLTVPYDSGCRLSTAPSTHTLRDEQWVDDRKDGGSEGGGSERPLSIRSEEFVVSLRGFVSDGMPERREAVDRALAAEDALEWAADELRFACLNFPDLVEEATRHLEEARAERDAADLALVEAYGADEPWQANVTVTSAVASARSRFPDRYAEILQSPREPSGKARGAELASRSAWATDDPRSQVELGRARRTAGHRDPAPSQHSSIPRRLAVAVVLAVLAIAVLASSRGKQDDEIAASPERATTTGSTALANTAPSISL